MAKVATQKILLALTVVALLFCGVFALTACGKDKTYEDPGIVSLKIEKTKLGAFKENNEDLAVSWDKKAGKYVVTGSWTTWDDGAKTAFGNDMTREGYIVLAFTVDEDAVFEWASKETPEAKDDWKSATKASADVTNTEAKTVTYYIVCALGETSTGKKDARTTISFRVKASSKEDAQVSNYTIDITGVKAPVEA